MKEKKLVLYCFWQQNRKYVLCITEPTLGNCVILSIYFYLMNHQSIFPITKKINQTQLLFWALIAWTIIGFFTRWDNNMVIGCVIYAEQILEADNVFFTTASLTLLTIGFLFQTKGEGFWFLLFELLFWLVKLFYIKGGYAVSIAGIPLFAVLFFDMIALCLRLMLLNSFLQLRFTNSFVFVPIVVFYYGWLYYFN